MKGFLNKDDYRLRFPPLKKNIRTDILVVGGGLEGILTAYCAAIKGKKVAVAEKFFIGAGRTAFLPGCLTPNIKSPNALKEYESAVGIITGAAADAGGFSVSRLPFFFFSEKPLSLPEGAEFFRGEDLAEFRQSVPDGVFIQNGCAAFNTVAFCKALAEKCRLSETDIYEATGIVSAFDGTATTDGGYRIGYEHIVNATGKGENGKRRFLICADFAGVNIPRIAFGDGSFSPLTAFSENGRRLKAVVLARTRTGALLEKRRLEEGLSALLGIPLSPTKIHIGECRGAFSVADICRKAASEIEARTL